MPDRRSVDELSVEELEEILAIRKHEAREARLKRLRAEGRVVDVPEAAGLPPNPSAALNDHSAAYPRRSKFSEVYEDDRPRRRFGPSSQTVRKWRDRVLLLIEISAVAGL